MKTNFHLRNSSLTLTAAVFALLLASCSKEELTVPGEESGTETVSSLSEKNPGAADRRRYEGKTNSDIRALDEGYDPSNPSGKKNRLGDDRLELVDQHRCQEGGCALLIDEKVTRVIPRRGDLGFNFGRSIELEPNKDVRYFQPKDED